MKWELFSKVYFVTMYILGKLEGGGAIKNLTALLDSSLSLI